MNRNRKSCLLLLVIFGSPILLFFLYLFVSSFFSRTETYYIPQLDMYVRTIIKPKDEYGYILFGDNPNLILSDSTDYIGVYTNISNSVIVKPNEDTIWFCSQIKQDVLNEGEYTIMNRPKEFNQNKYVIIDGINQTDTTFFHKQYMTNPIVIKRPYMEISIMEHFDGIWIKNAGDSVYTKINSLK